MLIFQEDVELPEFAAFVLLRGAEGRDTLRRYYRRYLDIAAGAPGAGFILESPTWRRRDDQEHGRHACGTVAFSTRT